MLDLVSNGRVEFGSGESSSEAELAGFGIDPLIKREQWLEGLEVAIRCMVEEPFTGVDGQYVKMPPRNVVPKPMQKPHPPLWVACSRRDTILLAAEKGMGALTFAFIDPEEARSWVGEYERTLAESCVPVGWSVNPQVACVTPMMLHHDEDEAIRRGVEGANFFGYSLGHFYVFGEHRPGVTDVWSEYEQRRAAQGFDPEAVARAVKEERLGAKVAAGDTTGLRGAIGTPDQVREYLRRYEEAGVDQVIFVLQAGRNRHEHIMESIELFGREVLPEFLDRDEAATLEKAERHGAGHRRRDGPQAPHASRPRRLLVPGHPSAVGRRRGQRGDAGLAGALRRRPRRGPARHRARHRGLRADDAPHPPCRRRRSRTKVPVLFNPFDPALRANPYPLYRTLREVEPIHRSAIGLVVLTRYDDVSRALRESVFSRDLETNAAPGPFIGRRRQLRNARAGPLDARPRPARPHPPAPPRPGRVHAEGHRPAAAPHPGAGRRRARPSRRRRGDWSSSTSSPSPCRSR